MLIFQLTINFDNFFKILVQTFFFVYYNHTPIISYLLILTRYLFFCQITLCNMLILPTYLIVASMVVTWHTATLNGPMEK